MLSGQQKIIFVIGGPGSGKGTHCKILQEKKGYHHISTGDLVRAKIDAATISQDDSEESRYIRETTKTGGFLPDEFILNLVKAEIALHPQAAGFLIDGCPRTLAQAELFIKQIKTPDHILYFNISDEVMRERMLARGQVEHREDDNPQTITRRITTYHEKTEPVITHLKSQFPEKFRQIDSLGEVKDVAMLVLGALGHSIPPTLIPESQVSTQPIKQISAVEFLYLYFTYRNFCDAVKELEQRYSTSEFEITYPFMASLFIIQEKEHAKKVLAANTSLGYQYHNADLAHGHKLNIIATPAFKDAKDMSRNPLWENIHKGLSRSTGDESLINKLIDKYIPIFFSSSRFMLDIQFEKFMLAFWCEYMFGDKVNVDEFTRTRAKLIETMRYAFYNNSLKNAPLIGGQVCRFYGWMKSVEFAQIDTELQQYIDKADSGLMYRFKEKLIAAKDFPADKVTTAVLDNAFDLVLVFDFLHNALYETLAAIVRNKLDADQTRRDSYAPGLRSAFLFPFRSRVAHQTINFDGITIPAGSHIYVNLLKAGLYHSYGPRACIGEGVTTWVKNRLFHHLTNIQLRVLNQTLPKDRAALCHCADVPMSPERYEVSWQYPRDYLQSHLHHYKFKNVEEFFDVLETFKNPRLSGYIIATFVQQIRMLNIDKDKLVIVVPEVRGIPIAAAIARELDLPTVYIRKEGKIPGPILSKTYKNAYSTETLEISKESDLKHKQVILIDDGIASGGTTTVCCELVEELGGEIKLILAMINHTYKEKIEGFKQYEDRVQTLFDFAAKAPKPANDDKSEEKPLISLSQ